MEAYAKSSRNKRVRRVGQRKMYSRPRAAPASLNAMQRALSNIGETKFLDTINATNGAAHAPTSLTLVDARFPLNAITIGSGAWCRIGRKITMKSLYLQGFFTYNAAVANVSRGHNARIMIVYDKQTNGALPILADILGDQINFAGATDTRVAAPTSGINLNNRDRFEVILDKRFWLPGSNNLGTVTGLNGGTTAEPVLEYRNLRGRETVFRSDGSPGSITDIASGSLLMCTFGDLDGTTAPWNFTFSCRLKFKDN